MNEEQEALWCLEQNTCFNKTYSQLEKETGKSRDYWYRLIKKYKKKWNFKGTLSKYHWFKLNGIMEQVVSDYIVKKESTSFLGKKYGISERTVVSYLKLENIEIRPRGFESRTQQDIFNIIDSEIKAYTIGLITADGNMSKDKSSLSITLTESDSYLLEEINKRLLNSSGNIFISSKKNSKNTATLRFHGKKLCNALIKHGIIPNKSDFLIKLSDEIPNELYHHYIRGLYDGDGVCSKQREGVRIGYCAKRKEFVEDYTSFLCEKLNLSRNSFFNTGNCWQISWSSKNDLKNFYNYIYRDCTICLIRKKEKLFSHVDPEVN